MALFKCPECGNLVSDTAKFCPKCGYDFVENPVADSAQPATDICEPKVSSNDDDDSSTITTPTIDNSNALHSTMPALDENTRAANAHDACSFHNDYSGATAKTNQSSHFNKKLIIILVIIAAAIICAVIVFGIINNQKTAESNSDSNETSSESVFTSSAKSELEYGINYNVGDGWEVVEKDNGIYYYSPDPDDNVVLSVTNEVYGAKMSASDEAAMVSSVCDGLLSGDDAFTNATQEDLTLDGACARHIQANNEVNGTKYYLDVTVIAMTDNAVCIIYKVPDADKSKYLADISAFDASIRTTRDTVDAAKEKAASDSASAAAAQEKAEKEKQAAATKGAGTYKVGTDIPAGTYKLIASGNGYYCVYPDSTKQDILENDNFTTCDYVTLEEGQYIVVKSSKIVSIDYAEPTTNLKGDGVYMVGFDCPAGEYAISQTGTGSSMGYYCIYNNATVERDIVDNDNFEGSTYCTVNDGEFLVLSRATATLSS